MAFPNIDIARVKDALTAAFTSFGSDATVLLRDGVSFKVKATSGYRFEQNLTDGLQAQIYRIKILTSEWDAASPGRPPEKGDLITLDGKKHAVQQRIRPRGISGENLLYVLEMQG